MLPQFWLNFCVQLPSFNQKLHSWLHCISLDNAHACFLPLNQATPTACFVLCWLNPIFVALHIQRSLLCTNSTNTHQTDRHARKTARAHQRNLPVLPDLPPSLPSIRDSKSSSWPTRPATWLHCCCSSTITRPRIIRVEEPFFSPFSGAILALGRTYDPWLTPLFPWEIGKLLERHI